MRMKVLAVAIALVAVSAIPVFADEWELGLSWTPLPQATDTNMKGELPTLIGFHFGYNFWSIAYASWDPIVVPPEIVAAWSGYLRPGYLNLFDIGLRFRIGPVIAYAEAGTNYLYLWRQGDLPKVPHNFGANLRLGAGLHLNHWGVNLSGTAVFSSFQVMSSTIAGLASDKTRDASLQNIADALQPSLNVVLYF